MTVAADMEGIRPADYDVMALYSPSDVKTVVESFGVDALPVVATFGDATLRAALGAGLKVRASAPSPEAPSMAKALDLYIGKLSRGEEVAEVEAKSDSAKGGVHPLAAEQAGQEEPRTPPSVRAGIILRADAVIAGVCR